MSSEKTLFILERTRLAVSPVFMLNYVKQPSDCSFILNNHILYESGVKNELIRAVRLNQTINAEVKDAGSEVWSLFLNLSFNKLNM